MVLSRGDWSGSRPCTTRPKGCLDGLGVADPPTSNKQTAHGWKRSGDHSPVPTQTDVANRFKRTRVIGIYLFQAFAAGSDLGVFAIIHLALGIVQAPSSLWRRYVPPGCTSRTSNSLPAWRYIRMPALVAGRGLVFKCVAQSLRDAWVVKLAEVR